MGATVFNHIATLEKNGEPIVRKVRLIPSRQNSFYAKYSALTAAQKLLAKNLAIGTTDFSIPPYWALPESEKISVLDTLLDYNQFRIASDEKNIALKKIRQALLVERGGLASQDSLATVTLPYTSTNPPHTGSPAGMVRLGLLQNNHLGTGLELRLRPAYYDYLQPDDSHIANSNLAMFDIRAIYINKRLTLRSLSLVDVETLNVSRTQLPGDGGLAWKVKFGFESQNISCQNCMVFNVTGGIGKAMPISNIVTSYAMLDLIAQTKYQDAGTIRAVPRIGFIGSPVEGWKSNFTIGQQVYTNGLFHNQRLIRWENRIGNTRDWDIRISYEDQVAREFQMAISTYW